jgi:hypothetical protein
MYWATAAELQSAIAGVPKQYDLKATFASVDGASGFVSGKTIVANGVAITLGGLA